MDLGFPSTFGEFVLNAWSFKAPHDWGKSPMAPWVALLWFAADLHVWWLTYLVETDSYRNAHKKYIAHKTTRVVTAHALSGVLETCVGLGSILLPSFRVDLAGAAAAIAILGHVPTGLWLAPKVWGLKHVTVTGYVLVGILRAHTALVVLFLDRSKLPDLWILLHMATVVRLVAYYISPWTSTDGSWKGDLVTDPIIYTFSVTVAAFATLSLVYPPMILFGAMVVLALAHKARPSRVSMRGTPKAVKGY